MSWLDLQDYVRTSNDEANDQEFLMQAYEIATAMVMRYVRETVVPEFVVEEAILKAAAELYHQREAPNGVKQFATFDGQAGIRVTRDPLDAARPILAPWMEFGIA